MHNTSDDKKAKHYTELSLQSQTSLLEKIITNPPSSSDALPTSPFQRPYSLRQNVLSEQDYKPRPHSISNHTIAANTATHQDNSNNNSSNWNVYKQDQFFNPSHRQLGISQEALLYTPDSHHSTTEKQNKGCMLDSKIRTYCIDNLNALNKFNKHEITSHSSRMGVSFLKSKEGKILYYDNKSKYYSFWALFSWKHSILSKRQTWTHLFMYLSFMIVAFMIAYFSGLAKSIQVVRVSEDVIVILVI
jgi:hypothetical protein